MGLAIGISAAGVGMSAMGQYQQGKYQQKVAQNNALIAEWQAEDAIEIGFEEEARFRTDAAKLVGSQKVALAAQGIEIDEGSAVDVLSDTAGRVEEDAVRIRNNAKRRAWGFKVQGQSALAQGELDAAAGTYGGVSTILTGGTRVYGLTQGIG